METKNKTTIGEKIIDDLKKTTLELEKLRVQVALGKAEAHDFYESSKKKFQKRISGVKAKLIIAGKNSSEQIEHLMMLLDRLQVQLALGKAETRDAFNEQRKKINSVLTDLEKFITTDKTAKVVYVKLLTEIKKFKIKLDIISLRYQLKKIEAGQEFEQRKAQFEKDMNELKKRIFRKEKSTTDAKWVHFKEEISEAYLHLKKALS